VPDGPKHPLPVFQDKASESPRVQDMGGPTVPPVIATARPQQRVIADKAINVLRGIFDPEVPVNLYDLGLIYRIDVDANDVLKVQMTLTAPACPVAESLPPAVEGKLQCIPEVSSATVDLVWDPPWTPQRMAEAAKLELGLT
jgi:FeS assembly SUF system protein